MAKTQLFSADDISISFNGKQILKNVSLKLDKEEIVTIIGPNGSGKTTFIRTILGLEKSYQGTVSKKDDITIGYIPQKMVVDKVMPLTVRRFLRINARGKRLRNVNAVESMAEDLGIIHLMKQQIHDVSGGEMQRIMLARALLLEPDLLVMDEPTQGLDVLGISEFYKLIENIKKKYKCGILMVSHDLHLVMATTDRVVCMNHHICCQGHPDEVSKNPEYLSLFNKGGNNIAIYTHHHDHKHDLDGNCQEDV